MASGPEVRKKSRTIRPLTQAKYETIKALVMGTFKVKTKDRTREQNNAITQYHRNQGLFEVKNGRLFYNNKEVVRKATLQKLVKSYFNKSHGCGARPLSQRLRRKYHGITERKVRAQYIRSAYYQRTYPRFTNKSTPRSIEANRVNQRWQIDLIDMRHESVYENNRNYRYILSVVDVFSRFLLLRRLESKTSKEVAKELEKIFADHGKPDILQCDQGTEFKGKTAELTRLYNVKVIRSRPYHPQSQGKCERSHLIVRKKIAFLKMKKGGFNWAQNLHKVQGEINETPKEVLANYTPFEVLRGNDVVVNKVRNASKRCTMRKLRNKSNQGKHGSSVYEVGEMVIFRFPPKDRVPRKRFILLGNILERNVTQGRYKIAFKSPSGNFVKKWINVEDITSQTVQKEKSRKKSAGKVFHRLKYFIPMTEDARMSTLDILGDNTVKVRLNPVSPGSCQFESVADQLSEYGIHRSSRNLRLEAVEHIRNFIDDYNAFIAGNTQQYLTKMEKDTEYGDHLTLLALAREYNVQILIISNSGIDHTTVVSNDGKINEDRVTLTLGHFPEHHYVSIAVAVETISVLKHHMTASTESIQNERYGPLDSDEERDMGMERRKEGRTEQPEGQEDRSEQIFSEDERGGQSNSDEQNSGEDVGAGQIGDSSEENGCGTRQTRRKVENGEPKGDSSTQMRRGSTDSEREVERGVQINDSDAEKKRGTRKGSKEVESGQKGDSSEEIRRGTEKGTRKVGRGDSSDQNRRDIGKSRRSIDKDLQTSHGSAEKRCDSGVSGKEEERGIQINDGRANRRRGTGKDRNEVERGKKMGDSTEENRRDIREGRRKVKGGRQIGDSGTEIRRDSRMSGREVERGEQMRVGGVDNENRHETEESRRKVEKGVPQVNDSSLKMRSGTGNDRIEEERSDKIDDNSEANRQYANEGRRKVKIVAQIGDNRAEMRRGARNSRQFVGKDDQIGYTYDKNARVTEEQKGMVNRGLQTDSSSAENKRSTGKCTKEIKRGLQRGNSSQENRHGTGDSRRKVDRGLHTGDCTVENTRCIGCIGNGRRELRRGTHRGDNRKEKRRGSEESRIEVDRGLQTSDSRAENRGGTRKGGRKVKRDTYRDITSEENIHDTRESIREADRGLQTDGRRGTGDSRREEESGGQVDDGTERGSNRLFERNELDCVRHDHPHLPQEILTIIIQMCLTNDPSSRYTLMLVSHFFQQVVDRVPVPEIYISPTVLPHVPRPVSVRRLVQAAGRNSGLVHEIRTILRNSRWYSAWLYLLEVDNRWFQITFIMWRRR